MRCLRVLTLLILASLSTGATAADIQGLLKLSKKLRAEAQATSEVSKKKIHLKSLESSIKTSLEDFQKQNPTLGDAIEEKVAFLYFSLEPVFKTEPPFSSKQCDKLRHQIDFEDRGLAPETKPLSTEAQDAMAWVSVFCP